jgi:hypothetical protein
MIEIVNYKPANHEVKQGSFNIKISKWGNFLIRELSYFKKGNQRWISFPSRSYEQDGKKKYYAFNGFEDQKTFLSFQEKVFESLDAYLSSHIQKPIEEEEVPF